jgi:hypothetical protein
MQPKEQTESFVEDTCPVRLDQDGEIWTLSIDPSVSYTEARAKLTDGLGDYADGLRGRNLRLNLGNRSLDLFEVRRISSLLRDGFQSSVIAVECTPESVHKYAEQSFKLPMITTPLDTCPRMPLVFTGAPLAEVFDIEEEDEAVPTDLPLPSDESEPEVQTGGLLDIISDLSAIDSLADVENTDIIEMGEPVPSEAGRRVMVLEKTLRSGKTIRFAGDVMVYGDVNAGAHIEADGNIVVFGSLRGLAHAGARGDDRAVIITFELGSPQLRIANHIGFTGEEPALPEEPTSHGLSKLQGDVVGGISSLLGRSRPLSRQFSPEIAWVENGEIRIDSYQGRLPA